MNKIKNKRILKNNAIGGYIYDKTQNKWKWKLFGKQNGGVPILSVDVQVNIFSYLDCEDFYRGLLELKIKNKPLYTSIFRNEIFINQLVKCTIQWRQLISKMYTHHLPNKYEGFGLHKDILVWYKIPGHKYMSGKVSKKWIPKLSKFVWNTNEIFPIINKPNNLNNSKLKQYELFHINTLIPNIFAINADFAEMLNNRIEQKSNNFPINSKYSNWSRDPNQQYLNDIREQSKHSSKRLNENWYEYGNREYGNREYGEYEDD
jgi:hypothetical protein